MKFLLASHAALALAGAAGISIFFSLFEAESFLLGSATIFFDFLVMAWIWPIIFAKKGFALSVSVIVFKFAILAWIMNEVATGGLIHQGWFSIGLAQVVLTSVLTALKLSRTEA